MQNAASTSRTHTLPVHNQSCLAHNIICNATTTLDYDLADNTHGALAPEIIQCIPPSSGSDRSSTLTQLSLHSSVPSIPILDCPDAGHETRVEHENNDYFQHKNYDI
jgi:hypothetical protein